MSEGIRIMSEGIKAMVIAAAMAPVAVACIAAGLISAALREVRR